jgi:Ca2+-binding EF-hand superfamily protein
MNIQKIYQELQYNEKSMKHIILISSNAFVNGEMQFKNFIWKVSIFYAEFFNKEKISSEFIVFDFP